MPRRKQLRRLVLLAAVCFGTALGSLGTAAPDAAEGAGPLRVWERKIGDETAMVVGNDFYEVVIRPALGASITSLRFGNEEKAEATEWRRSAPGGLLQEVHSADLPFKLVHREVGPGEASLEFACTCGPLVVRKRFLFSRSLPFFRAKLTFENHSRFPLGGADAPALSSIVLPAEGKQTGREYYCLGRGGGSRAITSATLLRELNPLRRAEGPMSWVAVTDPVTKRGIGFVFLDAGPRRFWAERNCEGAVLTRWRYRPVPAASALESELLVVPLEGFAAVSSLTPQFAADTTTSRAADGALSINLRIMPLGEDLADLSIVTRAYGADGAELEPCDTLHYGRIAARRPVVGKLTVRQSEARPAWFLHELYGRGQLVGRFLAPLSAGTSAPMELADDLPSPHVARLAQPEALEPEAGIPPDDEARERGFVFWQFEGGRPRLLGGPVHVALCAGERETLFFAVRALAPVGRLRVSIAAAQEPEKGLRVLHPAAAYLWSVEQDGEGRAYLVPFAERGVAQDETVWMALTLDASHLKPGVYSARLYLEGDAAGMEAPIRVHVSARRLAPHEGFALWFVDAGGAGPEPAGTAISKLIGYTVSALTLRTDGDTQWRSARRAPHAPGSASLDMLGFHSPASGAEGAERMARAMGGRMATLPAPGWLLWSGVDDLRAVEPVRAMGFTPAVVFPRLRGLEADTRWLGSPPEHWLVEGGCAPGAVAALLKAGRIRPEHSVWLFLDVRGMHWRKAALELRSAFWAAAWQELAGAAVLCPRPTGQVDRQSVLWHILRDAREEAALGAAALRKGRPVLDLPTGQAGAVLKRAWLGTEMESLIGSEADCLLQVEKRRVAFRNVLRAVPGGMFAEAPLAGFQAAKSRAIGILEEAEKLTHDGPK